MMKTLKFLFTNAKATLLLLLGATALVLSGCKEDDPPLISLGLDQSFISIGLDTPGQLTVKSNTGWTATFPEGDEWCQITPASGNGSTDVTITVADGVDASRSTTVLFATAGGVKTVSLQVIQNGADAPVFQNEDGETVTEITVDGIASPIGTGTALTIVPMPDGATAIVTSTESWLSGKVENGVLTVSATEDNTTGGDLTGILIVQITGSDDQKVYIPLKVIQSALDSSVTIIPIVEGNPGWQQTRDIPAAGWASVLYQGQDAIKLTVDPTGGWNSRANHSNYGNTQGKVLNLTDKTHTEWEIRADIWIDPSMLDTDINTAKPFYIGVWGGIPYQGDEANGYYPIFAASNVFVDGEFSNMNYPPVKLEYHPQWDAFNFNTGEWTAGPALTEGWHTVQMISETTDPAVVHYLVDGTEIASFELDPGEPITLFATLLTCYNFDEMGASGEQVPQAYSGTLGVLGNYSFDAYFANVKVIFRD